MIVLVSLIICDRVRGNQAFVEKCRSPDYCGFRNGWAVRVVLQNLKLSSATELRLLFSAPFHSIKRSNFRQARQIEAIPYF